MLRPPEYWLARVRVNSAVSSSPDGGPDTTDACPTASISSAWAVSASPSVTSTRKPAVAAAESDRTAGSPLTSRMISWLTSR